MNAAPTPFTRSLLPLPGGWHFLRLEVLDESRLALVGANIDLFSALHRDCARQDAGEDAGEAHSLASQARGGIWVLQDDQIIKAIEFPLLEPFPIIDQFADGRWLVVNARSSGHGNARIFLMDGVEMRRFELGDGIDHIKIDSQKNIWVGWFDEGVFGNDNWHAQGIDYAPSAFGLAAFDELGALLLHATKEPISDCCALNVIGDEAWACTYTDFPIWRISCEGERTWTTKLRGTVALAVDYPHVLAAGGYQDETDRVVLLKLEEFSAVEMGEWRLPFNRNDRAEFKSIDARGDTLHLVTGQQWHRWRVADFLRAKG